MGYGVEMGRPPAVVAVAMEAVFGSRGRCGSSSHHRRVFCSANVLLFALALCAVTAAAAATAVGDTSSAVGKLINTRIDRRIDLSTQFVKLYVTAKMENEGSAEVSEILLALPNQQAERLAYRTVKIGGNDGGGAALPVSAVVPAISGVDPALSKGITFFAVSLPSPLKSGGSLTLEIHCVFTRLLEPYPAEISQQDPQLVLYHDNHYFLSVYPTKTQVTKVSLFSPGVESYTKEEPTRKRDNEITYGFYHNTQPLAISPMRIHYENLAKFAVISNLVREMEVSPWGSVTVKEDYVIYNGGAKHKGTFSRLDYQLRPGASGAASFRRLFATLPPRAFDVYYRDEIGNISSSLLRGDSKKTELEVEPRFPMLGGWKVAFTIGYKLPLEDCVSVSKEDGRRVLTMPFGTPFEDAYVEDLTVEVALPEGAADMEPVVPAALQGAAGGGGGGDVSVFLSVKHAMLDITGRPVIVLKKTNVVAEHNVAFQVKYNFAAISMLRKPLLLISAVGAFFLACMVYARADFTISKSSPAYVARKQREEVIDAVQKVRAVLKSRVGLTRYLEASLKELTRKGEEGVAECKAVRAPVEEKLKETAKSIKSLVDRLESSGGRSIGLVAKVKDIIAKEKELQTQAVQKHVAMVEGYERKLAPREIDQRVEKIQQRLTALMTEVRDLLQALDE
ncbi:hypothetical protein CBR_g29610 [Chara braunii]|uniref:Dolichyl-diphosphooligosaccharide--protein glycosyltransferase subunit 1 n=1 Tax=Chara braunii TaxID=69332 RepID=A0A388LB09_CHABU|nr:hypothetical protein CBR_g29610 [Chara braunii]|eukprot:GBG79464.1 hypothetical protein CBR_g29610 [Chara braunii]